MSPARAESTAGVPPAKRSALICVVIFNLFSKGTLLVVVSVVGVSWDSFVFGFWCGSVPKLREK